MAGRGEEWGGRGGGGGRKRVNKDGGGDLRGEKARRIQGRTWGGGKAVEKEKIRTRRKENREARRERGGDQDEGRDGGNLPPTRASITTEGHLAFSYVKS